MLCSDRKKKFVIDLEEDDSRAAGISQLHNKPVDSGCCKSDMLTSQKTACCWISTAVRLREEVNEDFIVPKGRALHHVLTCPESNETRRWKMELLLQF